MPGGQEQPKLPIAWPGQIVTEPEPTRLASGRSHMVRFDGEATGAGVGASAAAGPAPRVVENISAAPIPMPPRTFRMINTSP